MQSIIDKILAKANNITHPQPCIENTAFIPDENSDCHHDINLGETFLLSNTLQLLIPHYTVPANELTEYRL